jgi:hypothetical protein
MAEISVGRAEIEMLMTGLNRLEYGALTEDERTTRAALAYKLGMAAYEFLPLRGTQAAEGNDDQSSR